MYLQYFATSYIHRSLTAFVCTWHWAHGFSFSLNCLVMAKGLFSDGVCNRTVGNIVLRISVTWRDCDVLGAGEVGLWKQPTNRNQTAHWMGSVSKVISFIAMKKERCGVLFWWKMSIPFLWPFQLGLCYRINEIGNLTSHFTLFILRPFFPSFFRSFKLDCDWLYAVKRNTLLYSDTLCCNPFWWNAIAWMVVKFPPFSSMFPAKVSGMLQRLAGWLGNGIPQ